MAKLNIIQTVYVHVYKGKDLPTVFSERLTCAAVQCPKTWQVQRFYWFYVSHMSKSSGWIVKPLTKFETIFN